MYESIKLKIIKSKDRLECKAKWDKKLVLFILLMAFEIISFEIFHLWERIDIFIFFIFIAILLSVGYQNTTVIDKGGKSITVRRGVWFILLTKSFKAIRPVIEIRQSKPLLTGVQIPMDIKRYTLRIMVDDTKIILASSSSKSEIESLKDTVNEYLPEN